MSSRGLERASGRFISADITMWFPRSGAEQFQPRVEGANLFGRGSSDMKSGLAAMIHAAAAARDEGLLKSGRIGIVLVPDEETAGPRGSRELEARGLLGRDGVGMLTPEPTGGVIWNANRGAISLRATMRGKAAHVGRQFEGVNAFERALPAVARLVEIKREVELRETAYHIAPAAARKSILMLGGRVEAGTNFNVTPDFYSFTIDRRINPEEDVEEEKRRLYEALEGFEIEVLQEERAAASCGGGAARRDSIAPRREREREGAGFRNVSGAAGDAILCGSGDSRVCLWARIANGIARAERIRADWKCCAVRSDLRNDGGGDVGGSLSRRNRKQQAFSSTQRRRGRRGSAEKTGSGGRADCGFATRLFGGDGVLLDVGVDAGVVVGAGGAGGDVVECLGILHAVLLA